MNSYHSKPNTFASHVHLKVENLSRSLAFYRDLMGFQITDQSETKATVTADGITPLLTIEQLEDAVPKQARTTGLYHYALLLPTRKDLGKLTVHLFEAKYPLQGASYHGTHDALYFQDPDGNGIEVAADTDPLTWRDQTGEFDFSKNGPMDLESVVAEAGGESWTGIPEGTVIGHLHLHVADLEKTKEFYQAGLGFEVTIEFPEGIFFSTGGYHHHIGTNIWHGKNAPKPALNSAGMLFYTLILPNEETRKSAAAKLESLGYSVSEKNGEFFTEDPAGNRIQLAV
ncbi:VOC family protein [Domibacillus indicus]|uniref:VOC family protein n=1 Tax=Domibacillus indicus TaxID=1437523 RepID=UPI00203CE960|nr:VOC family protein [Domibacillus indicus]MCM3791167.1 VOC family protein [Domibacillus indicus]